MGNLVRETVRGFLWCVALLGFAVAIASCVPR